MWTTCQQIFAFLGGLGRNILEDMCCALLPHTPNPRHFSCRRLQIFNPTSAPPVLFFACSRCHTSQETMGLLCITVDRCCPRFRAEIVRRSLTFTLIPYVSSTLPLCAEYVLSVTHVMTWIPYAPKCYRRYPSSSRQHPRRLVYSTGHPPPISVPVSTVDIYIYISMRCNCSANIYKFTTEIPVTLIVMPKTSLMSESL